MIQIESYKFGEITISGKIYTSDVLIFNQEVKADWWRKKGHLLVIDDIKTLLEWKPKILIVGLGYNSRMKVQEETIKELERKGVEVKLADTRKAVNLYNSYASKKFKVAAALHLTC